VVAVDLPWGTVTVTATCAGVSAVTLPGRKVELSEQEYSAPEAKRVARAAARELQAYAQGELQSFTVALDLSGLTGFQQAVLKACQGVWWGQTATYGELAGRVGKPGAARAVGQVMARNPVAIIIPCHRVVGSGGRLTGYGGGLKLKRLLLVHEGADVAI
jgi:methylated-DNA-[protein]-cysteine S-methyltransferase